MAEFFQAPPNLGNQYDADRVLRSFLKRKLPADVFPEIEDDLRRMGARVVGDIGELARAAEAVEPRHVPYDAWGNRIDQIEVSDAWKRLDRISAQERLIAIGYERKQGPFSRIHQFAKLYLFHPSSALYTCPLAMTDGAARALELYGDETLRHTAFRHLTSSDPNQFWTSGQWMTERSGGSDVGRTSTLAVPEGSRYRLYGTKWFTSATTSQMAMTLARIQGAPEGSKGLSLFYLELRDERGNLNGIRIDRLKEKLGTRALPTAELTLEGAVATLVGGQGDGIKRISSLFNITRIYNACSAVGYMRRAIALARNYAFKREAFGRPLSDHGLHVETLAELQMEFEAAFHLTFRTVELLGKEETGGATEAESAVLRLLTPLAKLYTAKQSVLVVSEALEAFGGAGYIEDTGLPRLLRDTQVLSIWEGTTNVLSLDALRAIRKEHAISPFLAEISVRLDAIRSPQLAAAVKKAREGLGSLSGYASKMDSLAVNDQDITARRFAYGLAQIYACGLLLEQAEWSLTHEGDPRAAIAASRWCSKNFAHIPAISSDYLEESRQLGLD